MDENNKDKKIGFWPTSWIGSNWSQITGTEKIKRITPLVIFTVVVLLDRFFGDAIAHSPYGPLVFNISLGVLWILELLFVVLIFKKGTQSYGTAMRIAMIFLLIIISIFVFGHYLGYF